MLSKPSDGPAEAELRARQNESGQGEAKQNETSTPSAWTPTKCRRGQVQLELQRFKEAGRASWVDHFIRKQQFPRLQGERGPTSRRRKPPPPPTTSMIKMLSTVVIRSSTRVHVQVIPRRFASVKSRQHQQQQRTPKATAAPQPPKRDERTEKKSWEHVRAFVENTRLTKCDRELSKEEIGKRIENEKIAMGSKTYHTATMRIMDLLLKSHRPLASLSVARYVVEQPDVSKPAFLRALQLTANAVAELGSVPASANDIIEKLRTMADTIKSDAMQPLLRGLFDSMSDTPLPTDAERVVPAVGAAARDLCAVQACAALRRRDMDGYRALSGRESKPIHADRALYETASRLAREDAKAARNILDTYLGLFSRRGQPITTGVFEQFTKPFLGLRPEWRLKPVEPVEGKCTSCCEKLKPVQPMPQREFESLKRETENDAASRNAGSPRELEALRRYAEIERQHWLKPKMTVIVVDFLNVFHARKFSEPRFWNLVAQLKKDFQRVYTVGRLFGIYIQKLKEQDVQHYYCGRSSKSDHLSMCLAMWLGADTKLLSNDLFEDLRTRLPGQAHRPFDTWYQQNVIGFSTVDFRYNVPPSFSRAVESSSSGYHVWTATERKESLNKQLAEYKLYCLRLDQPS